MTRSTVTVFSTAALVALTLACSNSSGPLSPTAPAVGTSLPADGSTLKASTPVPQSPINDQKLSTTDRPTLTASASTATYGSGVALQYRFEIRNDAGALVDSALINSTSWQVAKDLDFEKRHTWRVRAEYQGDVGAWSTTASFVTAEGAFIRGSQVVDSLTMGKTVGQQRGGHFVPGQGWQADTYGDGIDYDITTCSACRVEFDVTNFGKGLGNPADLKWLTMGDAATFGDFNAFRNHPWKMHLEQRGDGDGTGMKLIWRNGGAGGGEPGDHTAKVDPAVNWKGSDVYHFVFEWNASGFTISIGVNGGTPERWFQDGFGGYPYAPPNHRISLGCYPRNETMQGAIWRNVKVTPL